MGSKYTAPLALYFSLNLLLFSLVSSTQPITDLPFCKPKPPVPLVGKCPRDALKLGVCADVLKLVTNIIIGAPPTLPCCSLLGGLVDLEAAICLCTAIKATILGINLNIPIALSLVLNNCGNKLPNGYECS